MNLYGGKTRQQIITEQNVSSMYDNNRPSEVNTDGVISKSKDSYTELNRVVDNDIHKAGGEGSKGGKVIGHTKSGKPIYDHSGHEAHKSFSKEDHLDAAQVHREKMATANKAGEGHKHAYHMGNRDTHKALAEKAGENKVIGNTKSGKPIYDDPKHESHKSFTKFDHWDAHQAHYNNHEKEGLDAHTHSKHTDGMVHHLQEYGRLYIKEKSERNGIDYSKD